MSFVDDTRKLLQDLIAPELKSLQVQVASVEKSVSSLEKTMDARFAAMNDRMDALKESMLAETRVLSVTTNSSMAMMTRTLQDIDARLRRMEEERSRLGAGTAPAGAAPPAAA